MKKGDRVMVATDRCGMRGAELIVLWRLRDPSQAVAMFAFRPAYEAGWDQRPLFFKEDEVALGAGGK